MKHIILSILLAVSIQGLCFADVTKLPADDQKVLRDMSRFREMKTPANVQGDFEIRRLEEYLKIISIET
jgi:hypothetical protein